MRNQPILKAKAGMLELFIWYPVKQTFKVGQKLNFQTIDKAIWPATIMETRGQGMSICITLLLDEATSETFIKAACTSLQTTRLVKSEVTMLDNTGAFLDEYHNVEVHP